MMDYMFASGFLGTRAPFFMDFVMIMVVALPFLILIAISFAKKRHYKAHAISQTILYIVAVIVVGYFEYGVRVGGGYEFFVQGSSVSHNYAFYVLIFHIAVALIGFGIWTHTLLSARKDHKNKSLPGLYSASHKKAGRRAFIGIVLTALTGVWVYVLLFMV
jgi:putative membrane protein